MLIVALVLAVIGLAALVTAVVTSNELIAWVCIGASGLGVLLLVVDAIRERSHRRADLQVAGPTEITEVIEPVVDETAVTPTDLDDESESASESMTEIDVEDHPEELVHDEPDYDLPSDDEPDYPVSAEEAAIHTVSEDELAGEDWAGAADLEVHYAPSAPDSSATVVYTDEENTSVEIEQPAVGDEHRDQ